MSLERVRCKVRVQTIARNMTTRFSDGKYVPIEVQTITMNPVSAEESEENKAFWEATPSGQFQFGTVNAEAVAMFELGQTYYVDFTPAP